MKILVLFLELTVASVAGMCFGWIMYILTIT